MVEAVPDAVWHEQQHFITYSPWDANGLMARLAHDANLLLGGDEDTFLLGDESGFSKKGSKSVGVARQWNGRLGKIDNCQVGVFTALARRDRVTLIDTRLFLPEEWTNDQERCRRAGVPEDRLQHRTKPQLLLEMVKQHRANGVQFAWVSADALYGNDPAYLRGLDDQGETFMADVQCKQHIYLDDPKPYRPRRKFKRGRKPTRLKSRRKSIRVDRWVAKQPDSTWQTITLRQTTKGELTVRVLHRLVWLWDGKEQSARQWHLIVCEKTTEEPQRKYSMSNAPHGTPLPRLASMQSQRYWVERALQDAKSQAGLAEYQIRQWNGWHHHMAMCILVQLFFLENKIKHANQCPLLSCADVRRLLLALLPRRDVTLAEVVRQMIVRHKQRAASTASYRKKRRKKSV